MWEPSSLNNTNQTILGNVEYNGRINIVEEPSMDVRFQMQERIAVKNKTTEYREALTGTWEQNPLSNLFFSEQNVQIIQNGIRAGVYKMSNNQYVIAPQNIDTLKVIMRSIYLQFAEHELDNVTKEIERLNKIVWDYAIPTVYKEAKGYLKYCEDQSTLVVPLELPQHHDRQYKQLELKPWF
jgi:hypothetical protein